MAGMVSRIHPCRHLHDAKIKERISGRIPAGTPDCGEPHLDLCVRPVPASWLVRNPSPGSRKFRRLEVPYIHLSNALADKG